MYITDPTLFESFKAILPVVGWGTVIAGCILAFRWAWSLRGAIDGFLVTQTKASDLAQKTYNSVERVKSEALALVKAATEAGERKAAELKDDIQRLDSNHLNHIQIDMAEMNARNAEMNVKYDRLIGINSKQLEIAQQTDRNIAILVVLYQKAKD
jgi:hypothetical protein